MVREISRRCPKRTFDNKMKTNKAIEYVDKETEKNVTNIKPNEFQDFFDNLQNEAESSINIYMKGEKSQLTFKKRK